MHNINIISVVLFLNAEFEHYYYGRSLKFAVAEVNRVRVTVISGIINFSGSCGYALLRSSL